MSGFKLRAGTIEDAASISSLGSDIFRTTFGHSCTPEQMEQYLQDNLSPAAIRKELEDNKRMWLLAEDANGRSVGYAELNWGSSEPCITHPKAIELQRLYVALDQHGKGVAQLLTKGVEDYARQKGYELMWLGVWEENIRGQRFYEKGGYKRIGEHIFDVGGDAQTDWIMQKTLLS